MYSCACVHSCRIIVEILRAKNKMSVLPTIIEQSWHKSLATQLWRRLLIIESIGGARSSSVTTVCLMVL